MSFIFYIIISLIALILQTTFIPYISLFQGFYDLILVFVVCLGLFHSIRESMPILFIMGYVMDSISGSPFGLYMITYFWTYAGVVWAMRFLHVRSVFLLPLAVASAVILENIIFLISMFAKFPDIQLPDHVLSFILIQVLWALLTGPLLIHLAEKIYATYKQRYEDYRLKEDGYNQV